jgi:hypothetical protein
VALPLITLLLTSLAKYLTAISPKQVVPLAQLGGSITLAQALNPEAAMNGASRGNPLKQKIRRCWTASIEEIEGFEQKFRAVSRQAITKAEMRAGETSWNINGLDNRGEPFVSRISLGSPYSSS